MKRKKLYGRLQYFNAYRVINYVLLINLNSLLVIFWHIK